MNARAEKKVSTPFRKNPTQIIRLAGVGNYEGKQSKAGNEYTIQKIWGLVDASYGENNEYGNAEMPLEFTAISKDDFSGLEKDRWYEVKYSLDGFKWEREGRKGVGVSLKLISITPFESGKSGGGTNASSEEHYTEVEGVDDLPF